jgi:Domain of unknown function (DUF4177)
MAKYKVIEVAESGVSVIFLGASSLPLQKVEMELNKMSAQGWSLAFQVMEKKRFLLFWNIDRMVLTFQKE